MFSLKVFVTDFLFEIEGLKDKGRDRVVEILVLEGALDFKGDTTIL